MAVTGPDTRSKAHRTGHLRDAGQTLVEAVTTVVIIAIVAVPILSAVWTTVRASSIERNGTIVETVIVNAADRINRAPKVCDYTPYVEAAVVSQGWDKGLATVEQKYFVAGADPAQQGSWQPGGPGVPGGACVGSATKPAGLLVQLVKVTVRSPDGRSRRTIQVVKSDV